MNDPILAINASIGLEASKEVAGLENKIKASMRAVIKGDFLGADDDGLLRAAVGGVLLDVGTESEDGKRIRDTLTMLRKLGALLHAAREGLTVGLDSLDIPEDAEPSLPLFQWFKELKESL